MATHFEVTTAGHGAVAAIEAMLIKSQSLADSGTPASTTFSSLPASCPIYLTIVPDVNVYVAIGPGPTPSVTADPRHSLTAGGIRSFEFQPDWQATVVTR